LVNCDDPHTWGNGTLNVEGTSLQCVTIDKATGPILVIRVFFNDLTGQNRFLDFGIHYGALGHLSHSVIGKEQVSLAGCFLDRPDVHTKRL